MTHIVAPQPQKPQFSGSLTVSIHEAAKSAAERGATADTATSGHLSVADLQPQAKQRAHPRGQPAINTAQEGAVFASPAGNTSAQGSLRTPGSMVSAGSFPLSAADASHFLNQGASESGSDA